jgi:hypothetical protein
MSDIFPNAAVFVGRYEKGFDFFPVLDRFFPGFDWVANHIGLVRTHPRDYDKWIKKKLDTADGWGNSGIVIIANDPYLVDLVPPENVIVFNGASYSRLVDHPDYEKYKHILHPGEFWNSVGEDWVSE